MPSWKISVVNGDWQEPMAMPPTSIQCITTARSRPISSSASPVGRRVHDDVVEMLAHCAGMVGDHDVAMLQFPPPVDRKPVGDGGGERIGNKDRQAAA